MKELFIICGGKGTRIKKILNETPKILAKINGLVFLSFLDKYFYQKNIKKLILCTGFGHESIVTYLNSARLNCEIILSKEEKPLGTGGALKKAINYTSQNEIAAINGDTIIDVNLEKMNLAHIKNKANLTINIIKKASNKNQGGILIDSKNRVLSFSEKNPGNTDYVNTGVYIINKKLLESYNKNIFSLEEDFFPEIVSKKNAYGYISNKNKFLDFGTEEGYKNISKFII